MATRATSNGTLLIHDGELSDVLELVGHLAIPHTDCQGIPPAEHESSIWDLVIATPKRLLEFHPDPGAQQPVRLAVTESSDSKTLRAMLGRAGVDMLVRRPVHPAALRLLILHSLYRGPEKRRALRVTVGARVRFRLGLRKRMAVLADLSATGCRLLSSHGVPLGRQLVVQVPAEVAADKAFALPGTVVRRAPSDFPGIDALAVSFGELNQKTSKRLRATIAHYGSGPAALDPGDASARLALESSEETAPAPETASPVEPPVRAAQEPPREEPATEPAPEAAGETLGAQAKSLDRRDHTRHVYDEQIVAMGVEAARVLLGRDVSLGGMRVDSHPDVSIDDEMQLGLHLRGREEPLLVNARVIRDDRDRGMVLQFFGLDDEAQSYLERMVKFLPILAMRGGDDDAGVIVCEIMDHQPQAAVSA